MLDTLRYALWLTTQKRFVFWTTHKMMTFDIATLKKNIITKHTKLVSRTDEAIGEADSAFGVYIPRTLKFDDRNPEAFRKQPIIYNENVSCYPNDTKERKVGFYWAVCYDQRWEKT